jgi:hypothetical protein
MRIFLKCYNNDAHQPNVVNTMLLLLLNVYQPRSIYCAVIKMLHCAYKTAY